MNSRTIAGLGMMLLAVGLLTIYFLDFDFSNGSPGSPKKDAPTSSISQDTAVEDSGPRDVSLFLADYNSTFKSLWSDAEEARWVHASSQTKESAMARGHARQRFYDYTGNRSVIAKLSQYRGRLDVTRLQDRQIERAWRLASLYPATSSDDVLLLMDVEVALVDSLQSLSAQLIPGVIPADPLEAWQKAQTLGLKTKDGLVEARDLRNKLARSMGYSSFYALAADRYGMESEEFLQLMDELVTGIAPLYQQLHCVFKNETAPAFGPEVPRLIPAHWIPTLAGGEWPMETKTETTAAQMDSLFHSVQPQWILEQAENFHVSLGFAPLPLGFWGSSSLDQLPESGDSSKSRKSEAWHINLDQNVRVMMALRSDFASYGQAHKIVAETYYHLAYSREEVPAILRQGANPAFVPAMGMLMELAAKATPSLMDAGLVSPGQTPDLVKLLLDRAIHGSVLQIPLLCGTLAHWEFDLYEKDLPRHLFNTRWWEYSVQFQGIKPASNRGEMDCTPAIRADVIGSPTRGVDEALGLVIAHQLHRYICKNILNEDVRLANYRGRTAVGRYLQSVMQLGATRDWTQVMREATGEELSSEALLEYYQPLSDWLAEQNAGRDVDFSQTSENQTP